MFLCFVSENSSIFPSDLVGNHICTSRYLKCVCVCETHLKDSFTPSVLVLFREQSMPVGSMLSFSENSFMPLALCYLFQRQLYSQCLEKE